MVHKMDFLQHFRDAEANGLIGVRGYQSYFQDAATEYMYHLGKGNDILPEQYHMAWVYTKYRLHVYKEVDYAYPLHVETWISRLNRARLWQDMEIRCGEELCCRGRLENCILHLEEQTLKPISAVDFPMDVKEAGVPDLPAFARAEYASEGMEERFIYHVRYADLDKSHHMQNLRYLPMFMDACPPSFYEKYSVCDMELHYIQQARYGDALHILAKEEGETVEFLAVTADGVKAAWCRLGLEKREEE